VLGCAALVFETQLIHEAVDQVEDRAGGIRTTWLTLGPRWTAVIAALSGFSAAVAAAGMVPAARSTAVAAIVAATFVSSSRCCWCGAAANPIRPHGSALPIAGVAC